MAKRRKQSGDTRKASPRSAKQVLQNVGGDPARIDLLFTMSEIPQADVLVKTFCCEVMYRGL